MGFVGELRGETPGQVREGFLEEMISRQSSEGCVEVVLLILSSFSREAWGRKSVVG